MFFFVAAKKGTDNQAALSETPKTSAKPDGNSSQNEAEKASVLNASLDSSEAQSSGEKDDVLKDEEVSEKVESKPIENIVEEENVNEEEKKNEEVEENHDEKNGSVEKMDTSAPDSAENDDKGILCMKTLWFQLLKFICDSCE